MAKYIELGITYIDRSAEIPIGRSGGAIRWNEEDLSQPPEIMNPIDQKVVLLLKRWIAAYEAELAGLATLINK